MNRTHEVFVHILLCLELRDIAEEVRDSPVLQLQRRCGEVLLQELVERDNASYAAHDIEQVEGNVVVRN